MCPEQVRLFQRSRRRKKAPINRPKVVHPIRPIYDDATIERMLKHCTHDTANAEQFTRNQAIILMLLETGLRASELCALTDEQLSPNLDQAWVIGKGDERGWVFLGPRAAAALPPVSGTPPGATRWRALPQQRDARANL